MERPKITKGLDSSTFRSFYYLKEELIEFCKEHNLPLNGSKIDITNRIAKYLDNGEIVSSYTAKPKEKIEEYTLDTIMSAQSITKLYNAEAKRENITRFTKRVPGIEKTLLGTAYVGTRIFLRNSWCGR